MRSRLHLTAGIAFAAAIWAGILFPLAARAGPGPTLSELARIQGRFSLTARITDARRVYGEHRGQTFTRLWTFSPTCATGSCSTIGLVRQRAGGSDRVLLVRIAPGLFLGRGSFYAPLRCGRRTYLRGAAVPFTITVRVTDAIIYGPAVFATGIDATYVNRRRTNLTPCVAFLGHDAASLQGRLAPAAATPTPG